MAWSSHCALSMRQMTGRSPPAVESRERTPAPIAKRSGALGLSQCECAPKRLRLGDGDLVKSTHQRQEQLVKAGEGKVLFSLRRRSCVVAGIRPPASAARADHRGLAHPCFTLQEHGSAGTLSRPLDGGFDGAHLGRTPDDHGAHATPGNLQVDPLFLRGLGTDQGRSPRDVSMRRQTRLGCISRAREGLPCRKRRFNPRHGHSPGSTERWCPSLIQVRAAPRLWRPSDRRLRMPAWSSGSLAQEWTRRDSTSRTALTPITSPALMPSERQRKSVGRPLAVIADLCGPKIRLGPIEDRTVRVGDLIDFAEDGR